MAREIVQSSGGLGRRNRPNRRLQALRINRGWSPNQLAYEAGIAGNTVRMAEAGFRPSPRVQFAIAHALDLQPLDIWPIEEQR
jgi:lambda repressor-like predicted transcriptional regulator